MTNTDSKRYCSECGLELSHTATGACCTGCLLRLAMPADEEGHSGSEIWLPPGLKSRFFGDYEIKSEIARGGMGVVYEARQLSLKRTVALKMIQASHLLSADARLRFGVEIEAVAQLSHPHIVSLYESGEYEGTHFFTMKLVQGGNLSNRFQDRPPIRDLIRLLVKVCRAVHYAHQRGILHRDLKPSNILVDEQGEPHVADFGLAKSIDQDSGFTFTSTILGSPNYMAPEQASRDAGQLTTAVDIYGLGAILFEMLAGRPPFQAATPLETIRQVVDTEAVAPRKFNSNADGDLEVIALKCLNKEPSSRYGTAEDLALDLERWLAGEPIQARPLGKVGTAWRWAKRHPAVASLGFALMLALISIVVGVSYAAVQINRADHRVTASLRKSLLGEARVLRQGGNLGRREEGLRLIQEAATLGGPPEFHWETRNEMAAMLARTDMAFVEIPNAARPRDSRLCLMDPQFERIVTVENRTNIVVLAAADGREVQRFASPDLPITSLERFSPEGRFFAARQPHGLGVWDLQSGQRCHFVEGTNQVYFFTAGLGRLAVQETPYEIIYYRLPTSEVMSHMKLGAKPISARDTGWHVMAVSPNRKMVAASSGPSRWVEIVRPQTGEIIHFLNMGIATTALAWSQDNKHLAVATVDGKIMIWDAVSTQLRPTLPPLLPAAHRLAFDPSNNWLAAAGGNDRIRIFDLANSRFSYEFRADSPNLSFDPTGTRLGLLQVGDRWGWLEFDPPREYKEFIISDTLPEPLSCEFSPDGSLLLSGNITNVVISDVTTGREFGNILGTRITSTVFDPTDSAFFLAGTPGLFRLPQVLDNRNRIALGTRKTMIEGRGWRAFSFSQNGQWFAAANIHSNAAFVFDRTFTNILARLGPHHETDSIAISPDGRWVTTGSFHDRSILVWDVARQQVATNLLVGPLPRAVFSGDGKWLATYGDGLELRETATWNLAPPLPFPDIRPVLGAAAFSPDGRIMAVVADHSAIHLIDLLRFQPLGILRPPSPVTIFGISFAPDGSKLAAMGEGSRAMIWDLVELRRSLAHHHLDWDLPALPDSSSEDL